MFISSRTPEGSPNHCPVCGHDFKIEASDPPGDAPCPCCGHLVWFTWDGLGDAQVIKPTGELTHPERLDRLFASLMMIRKGTRLVVDLEDVSYLSSAVLGRLINVKKKLGASGVKLRLRGVHPDLREIFRLTRLDEVLEIEAS